MKHRKNEGREGEKKKAREGKKALKGGGNEGRGIRDRENSFPVSAPECLVSMQVLIKRIQKRGASSFVWRCGTGSFEGG